jgi:RimJ/RimL family protein N-acetyltransferase
MSDLSLRQADSSDSNNLFDLRNHPQVRRHSHSPDVISLDKHQSWFQKTLLDVSKKIYIAEEEDNFIGMVRLDFIDGAYLMSWAVSPKFQGRGFGKEMVSMGSKTTGGIIKAAIKQSNKASIKIAEHIGMKLTQKIGDTLFYQK